MKDNLVSIKVKKAKTWIFGSAIGAGSAGLASLGQCSAATAGVCSTCGGCLIPLAAVVGWALMKKKNPQLRDSSQHSHEAQTP